MNKKTITVFGSSLPAENEEQYETAYKLGRLLAKNHFDLCTGGYKGIMEAVSKGASENNGKVIGVTLTYAKAIPNKFLSEEIKCKTLFKRVQKLIDLGDAYVILRGGTGTLLELASVWEFMNKNLLDVKPIICHSEMWKNIGNIIDRQIEYEKRAIGLVKYFDNVDGIIDCLKNYFYGGLFWSQKL